MTTKAEQLGVNGLPIFLDRFDKQTARDIEYDCEHGHLGCSTYAGGPCLNEALALAESFGLVDEYGDPRG